MLELTKRSITEKSGEIVIKAPNKELNEIAEVFKQFLLLAKYEVHEVNAEDEDVFNANEVLPEPTPASLLRGARFREDMTQVELAKKVETHPNNISGMERGVRPISVDMAKRLGKVLNVNYKRFL